MMEFIEVVTTYETKDDAEKSAHDIVAEKLGACCSIIKAESVYKWNNEIMNSQEYQLTIKTRKTLYKKLEQFILKNHSYKNPQIIAVPIVDGSQDYLNWINEETT